MDSSIRIADVAEQLAAIERHLRAPSSMSVTRDPDAAIGALMLAQAILRELDALAQRHSEPAQPGVVASTVA